MTRAVFFTLMLVCLLVNAPAWAGVDWSYEWTQGVDKVVSTTGNHEIRFTPADSGFRTGSQAIPAVTFAVEPPMEGTDSFSAQHHRLTLVLRDMASGDSATVPILGVVSGTLANGAWSFIHGFSEVAPVHLGSHDYAVNLTSENGPSSGLISALVTVSGPQQTEQQPPLDTPEPASALLAGLGATCAAAATFVKRKWVG